MGDKGSRVMYKDKYQIIGNTHECEAGATNYKHPDGPFVIGYPCESGNITYKDREEDTVEKTIPVIACVTVPIVCEVIISSEVKIITGR